MKFLVVTNAELFWKDGQWWGYGPYVREMNIWLSHVKQPVFVCPLFPTDHQLLLQPLVSANPIRVVPVPLFNTVGWKGRLNAIHGSIVACWKIGREMYRAEHIHVRSPNNIGLLGCLIQLFFPGKRKTAKYAGNWDWKSTQPFSYRFQQTILTSTLLTHNMKVLVYGEWPNMTRNLMPFFTASYSKKLIRDIPPRPLSGTMKMLFVGDLYHFKRPILAIEIARQLQKLGVQTVLHIYGNGPMYPQLQQLVKQLQLEDVVYLHGYKPYTTIVSAMQESHFLLQLSMSEGWPKALAEAMFWGCVPVATPVSCVPYMLDNGNRGLLVSPDANQAATNILQAWQDTNSYAHMSRQSLQWSQQFTLERFEEEIIRLL